MTHPTNFSVPSLPCLFPERQHAYNPVVVDNRQTRPYPEDYPEISGQDIPAEFEWRPSFTGEQHLPPYTLVPHSRNARNSATDLISSYGVVSSASGIRVNAGKPPLSPPPPGRPPKPLPRLSLVREACDISRTKSEMALHVMPVSGFLILMFFAWLLGCECASRAPREFVHGLLDLNVIIVAWKNMLRLPYECTSVSIRIVVT